MSFFTTRDQGREPEVHHFPNDLQMTPFEKRIAERISRGEIDESSFVQIYANRVVGRFLILLSNPLHPRNNWSILLQKSAIKGHPIGATEISVAP
jgi:hypothetical protein